MQHRRLRGSHLHPPPCQRLPRRNVARRPLAKKLAAAELNAAQVKAAFEKVAAQTVERRLKEIEDQRLRHEADLVATRADERRRLERVLAERAPSAAAAAPESAPRAKRNRS